MKCNGIYHDLCHCMKCQWNVNGISFESSDELTIHMKYQGESSVHQTIHMKCQGLDMARPKSCFLEKYQNQSVCYKFALSTLTLKQNRHLKVRSVSRLHAAFGECMYLTQKAGKHFSRHSFLDFLSKLSCPLTWNLKPDCLEKKYVTNLSSAEFVRKVL